MTPILPGQAADACHEGKVWIVICDERENLQIGGVTMPVNVERRNAVVRRVVAE